MNPVQFGPLTFTNPLGLWALLGIPAIIAIHFIQQRFRVIKVSTLFLLESINPIDTEGRKLDWIRNSLQLWLQLLLVLAISLLLSAPQWALPGTVQRIVAVLDSSYSMGAFSGEIQSRLGSTLNGLAHRADKTEWVLRETDPTAGTLYSGLNRADFDRALSLWLSRPRIGNHRVEPALTDARRLAGQAALVLLVTDHKQTVPDGVSLLSIGREIENWGLTGFRVTEENGETGFEALLRNYSKTEGARSWWFETTSKEGVTGKGEAHPVTLSPQSLTVISGKFPTGVDSLTLAVSGDEFALDDRLPIVRPKGKTIKIFGERGDLTKPFKKIISSLPDLTRTQRLDEADLKLLVFSNPQDIPSSGRAIVFFTPEAGQISVAPNEPVIADRHRLIDGLNWSGLVPGKSAPLVLADSDQPLLWSGQIPLLIIRHKNDLHLLIVNLDALNSNAFQTPAFIVMLHRFLDSLRPEIAGYEKGNFELGQNLRLAKSANPEILAEWRQELIPSISGGSSVLNLPLGAGENLRAPLVTGFFTIFKGNEPQVGGSAYFADAIESDFNGFSEAELGVSSGTILTAGQQSLTPFLPWLILALSILLLATWASGRPARRPSPRAQSVLFPGATTK